MPTPLKVLIVEDSEDDAVLLSLNFNAAASRWIIRRVDTEMGDDQRPEVRDLGFGDF